MSYETAKAAYAACGVDTEAALAVLKAVPVSRWQGTMCEASTPTPASP